MNDKYKMVYVVATDWELEHDEVLENHKFFPVACYLVGWLTRIENDYITITSEIFNLEADQPATFRGSITIPRQCVVELVYLKEKNKIV